MHGKVLEAVKFNLRTCMQRWPRWEEPEGEWSGADYNRAAIVIINTGSEDAFGRSITPAERLAAKTYLMVQEHEPLEVKDAGPTPENSNAEVLDLHLVVAAHPDYTAASIGQEILSLVANALEAYSGGALSAVYGGLAVIPIRSPQILAEVLGHLQDLDRTPDRELDKGGAAFVKKWLDSLDFLADQRPDAE